MTWLRRTIKAANDNKRAGTMGAAIGGIGYVIYFKVLPWIMIHL